MPIAETKLEISYSNNRLTFTINASEGDLSVIPRKRNYKIFVKDIFVNEKPLVFEINDANVCKRILKQPTTQYGYRAKIRKTQLLTLCHAGRHQHQKIKNIQTF